MAAESLSRRAFPAASAAVAAVVARRRRRHPRCWAGQPRRLPRRADRARADRRVLLRDQSILRLVAAVGDADRSQHPGQRAAGAGADRRWRLQAGFMEECLFRAVPLVDRRAARQLISAIARLLIAIALVLQAIVFGAAHANYPGFPSYSRLVELVGPAFVWGLIFLRFGLLTTVILHAVFDLTLMSIPVFLIEAPGQHDQPGAGHCGRAGAAGDRARAPCARKANGSRLPRALRNGAWQAPARAGGCRAAARPRRGRRVDRARAARAAAARACRLGGHRLERRPAARYAAAARRSSPGRGQRRRSRRANAG